MRENSKYKIFQIKVWKRSAQVLFQFLIQFGEPLIKGTFLYLLYTHQAKVQSMYKKYKLYKDHVLQLTWQCSEGGDPVVPPPGDLALVEAVHAAAPTTRGLILSKGINQFIIKEYIH